MAYPMSYSRRLAAEGIGRMQREAMCIQQRVQEFEHRYRGMSRESRYHWLKRRAGGSFLDLRVWLAWMYNHREHLPRRGEVAAFEANMRRTEENWRSYIIGWDFEAYRRELFGAWKDGWRDEYTRPVLPARGPRDEPLFVADEDESEEQMTSTCAAVEHDQIQDAEDSSPATVAAPVPVDACRNDSQSSKTSSQKTTAQHGFRGRLSRLFSKLSRQRSGDSGVVVI